MRNINYMKMRISVKKSKIKWPPLIISVLVFISVIAICIQVYAADETTYFGSESYSWSYGETYPIGIYASSSETISSVNITVTYDPDMLEYADGGTLVEEGMIQIVSDSVESTEFKRLLYFVPVCSGSTVITIESAILTDIYGNITTVGPTSVNVENAITEDALLETLIINGTEISVSVEEGLTYSVDVESADTELEIEYAPNTLEIEVSDSTLTVGENTVYVYVTGASGGRTRYTFVINFTEAETEIITTEAETATEAETETETETVKPGFINKIKRHLDLAAFVLILIMFLAGLILDTNKAVNSGKNKKTEKKDRGTFVEVIPLDLSFLEEKEKNEKKTIIDVSHITMEFKRDKDESTSLKELIIRFIKGQHQIVSFKALDDVSFSIKEGEVVGIIGTNGSGKSTMLKIISGVLSPTEGEVKVDKSKVQLLTLGTGFDLELTGRENVYLNGAVIGYSKQFIDEHFDQIVEFAELEGFMDEKVRNYSSGMISRLGFAIATAGDAPEILILDEVLSVGDMFFRKKSEARIKELIHGGSTVLIVSHNTGVIRTNCTKVIWIEKSHLKMIGEPDIVCKAYETMNKE